MLYTTVKNLGFASGIYFVCISKNECYADQGCINLIEEDSKNSNIV